MMSSVKLALLLNFFLPVALPVFLPVVLGPKEQGNNAPQAVDITFLNLIFFFQKKLA